MLQNTFFYSCSLEFQTEINKQSKLSAFDFMVPVVSKTSEI